MEEINAICPICGEEIILDYTPEVGEVIYCPQCGGSSEVIRTEPFTLQKIEDPEDFTSEDKEIY